MTVQRKQHRPKTTTLPETGFLRVNQIVGDDTHPAIIPVSKSSWWAGVKSGIYPQPIKLSARVTCWRVEDIRALIEAETNVAA